ncbi:MAG: 2-dehydropantoate 2-reductase [Acidobacteriota bacterium]|nr:2-dehydropantoate 2-reductase [Acidobacteriota bacterium]
MKLCIYGAGAIGGYLGAELALSGNDVTLIARGPHLQAIQKNGLTLIKEGASTTIPISCTDDTTKMPPQDYVIITLKAHSVASIVDRIPPLLGPTTPIITAQNGIPWWYFYKLIGSWEGFQLKSVDPENKIWDTLCPERAIGCVVYPSSEIVEPGVIRHIQGKRFMLGEPDGSKSDRITTLSHALNTAGLKAPIRTKIRDDIWLKLWGNVSFNPVSALTLATLDQIVGDKDVRKLIHKIMTEAQSVATQLGVQFPVDVDRRINWAADVGSHKTSMLQDLEMGRELEIDALVAAVAEMGRLVDVPTPTIDVLLSLLRLRAQIEKINR